MSSKVPEQSSKENQFPPQENVLEPKVSGQKKGKMENQKLKQVFSRSDIVWMVIAATLGGGLFTLLTPAIEIAGGAILFVILLNGVLALSTSICYAKLSEAMPDVGGGQQWIRKGMGSFWGHTTGWVSWLAHSVACGIYAISLGFYVYQFLFGYVLGKLDIHVWGSDQFWEKTVAVLTIIFLSVVNYIGVKSTGRVNKYGAIFALGVLIAFVVLGFWTAGGNVEASKSNFDGLFSYGISGLLAGMGLFYLAFQGSEVAAQSGEEVKNSKDISRGIMIGLFVIIATYMVVVFSAIAGTHTDSSSIESLGKAKEGALVFSALHFTGNEFLFPAILVAGIVIALIALNATIYSSSHAFLALARSQSIPTLLAKVSRFGTPSFGIAISAVLIVLMAVALPLHDIAAVADVLFMFLFIVVHFAYRDLQRRGKVAVNSKFLSIFLHPYLTGIIYFALILFLWNVSPMGVLFGGAWLVAGWVLYNKYTQVEEFREIDSAVAYNLSVRRGRYTHFKVQCPLPDSLHVRQETSKRLMLELAHAIARKRQCGLELMHVSEIPQDGGEKEYTDFSSQEQKAVIEKSIAFLEPLRTVLEAKEDISFGLSGVAVRDVPEHIHRMVWRSNADVLIMPVEQFSVLKRGFLRSELQRVLREVKCDLVVAKIGSDDSIPQKILVPFVSNPNNFLVKEIVAGLVEYLNVSVTFLFVEEDGASEKHFKKVQKELAALGFLADIKRTSLSGKDLASSVAEYAKDYDMIVMAASRGGSLNEITLGKTADAVLEKTNKTTIVVHHHQEILDPLFVPFVLVYRKAREYFQKNSSP